MDSYNSLTSFFYNIVPGVLFIFSIDKYTSLKILTYFGKDNTSVNLFAAIVLGLMVGFFFQALVKLTRNAGISKCIFNSLKNEEDETGIYDNAKDIIKKYGIIGANSKNSLQTEFHIMDNYLRGEKQAELIDHFAGKAAFWGNIFFGTLIILLLSLFKLANLDNISSFIFLILVVLSAYMSWQCWKAQYSIVIKSFVSVIRIEKIGDRNKIKLQ